MDASIFAIAELGIAVILNGAFLGVHALKIVAQFVMWFLNWRQMKDLHAKYEADRQDRQAAIQELHAENRRLHAEYESARQARQAEIQELYAKYEADQQARQAAIRGVYARHEANQQTLTELHAKLVELYVQSENAQRMTQSNFESIYNLLIAPP
jgi:hypothetical protein